MPMQPAGFVVERDFSIGSVLGRTFSTLFQNPILFFGLPLVASVPSAVIGMVYPPSFALMSFSWFFNMFMGLVVQGAIAYGVFLALRGDDSSFGEILSRGLTQFLPILLAAILTTLCFLLGFIFFVIPGIILMCVLAVTTQACAVEQLGAIESMNRSAELTKGYRWHIFGLYVIGFVIFFAGFMIIGVIAGLLVALENLLAVTSVLDFIGGVAGLAFDAVMCGIIYYDLRIVKEGLTLDNLADIFD